KAGAFAYVLAFLSLAGLILFAARLSRLTTFIALGAIVLLVAVGLVEWIACGRFAIQQDDSRKQTLFSVVTLAPPYLCVALLFFLLWTNVGVLRLRGGGMAGTVREGELVLYGKHPDEAKLVRGRLIAFKTTEQSAWGRAGDIVLCRILAAPSDALGIEERKYLVNGKTGPEVATTGEFQPVLDIPLS